MQIDLRHRSSFLWFSLWSALASIKGDSEGQQSIRTPWGKRKGHDASERLFGSDSSRSGKKPRKLGQSPQVAGSPVRNEGECRSVEWGKLLTTCDRGPGIGLMNFNGDTIVKKSIKYFQYFFTDFRGNTIVAKILKCTAPKNISPFCKRPWWRLSDLGSKFDYREAVPKHHCTMTLSVSNQNGLRILALPQSPLLRKIDNQSINR